MSPRRTATRALARVPGGLVAARLVRETVRVCLRYRVTGLASEAGFFALLSLPPLILGLVGGLGYVGAWLGQGTVDLLVADLARYAQRFLTDESVGLVLVPTMDEVLRSGRLDVLSLGFVLSLWSGSRALNVFLDTISIMYGQSGVRGIVRSRALSFSLYTVAVVVGAVVLPLVLAGPDLLARALPGPSALVSVLYWPLVTGAVVWAITSLFHIATPRRSPWRRDLPGAVLTVVLWVVISYVVRAWLGASVGGTSIYGPLAAPIVLLVWFYFLAIAVLIGAAMNAAVRHLWPVPDRASARERMVSRVRTELETRREPTPPAAAARSPWGPVIAGLVPAASGGDAWGVTRLDAPQRNRLVSVSTHGG
ncbi:YihY/virulence factor BrkB family protein [Arsenicicoccus sp. oral taxon 190]|uniref:YihY/virulence factor BrkB family protein n=1 Tax=Arsenicicoccus sp. oral taxon 190 TaxID=1658671 RepID=UPI00067B5B9F|nr:YihY/virulence factor BrkB family protein [Arsenicicoccus sp. oral taxon 190]